MSRIYKVHSGREAWQCGRTAELEGSLESQYLGIARLSVRCFHLETAAIGLGSVRIPIP